MPKPLNVDWPAVRVLAVALASGEIILAPRHVLHRE
jgi:hypothetical protein